MGVNKTNDYACNIIVHALGEDQGGPIGGHDLRIALIVIFFKIRLNILHGKRRKDIDPIGKTDGVMNRRQCSCTSCGIQLHVEKKER